jgi:hypothetical protein
LPAYKTLKRQRVEGYEMKAYIMQVIPADEHPDYLQVIGEDADYLHIIDDNFSPFHDEPGYSELDDVESYNELEFQQQQQSYRSHIEDESAYQDIGGDEPNHLQFVDNNFDHEQTFNDEQNQAANTSEHPLNFTADLAELRLVAKYKYLKIESLLT